jgi:hypothetical protein
MIVSRVCFTTSFMMSGKISCSSIFAFRDWYLLGVPQEVTPFFKLTQNIVYYQDFAMFPLEKKQEKVRRGNFYDRIGVER